MEFLLSLLPLDVADFVGRNPGAVAGTPLAGLIAWILKKIPNDKIKNASYKFCHGVGVVVTLGLA